MHIVLIGHLHSLLAYFIQNKSQVPCVSCGEEQENMEINRAVEPPRSLLGQDVAHAQCFNVTVADGTTIPFLQTALFSFICLASPKKNPTCNLFSTKQTSDATQTKYKTPIQSEMPSPCE